MGQALKTGQYVIGFLSCFFISTVFFSNAKANPDREKLEIKLEGLNKELLAFRSFLSNTEASVSETEKLLRSSEKELNILVNRIEKKKLSIKNNKRKVKLLEKKKRMLV